MVYQNILDAMGNTPMIQLNHMVPEGAARILVKFEGLNVGGSIKTRTAYNMICDAEEKGVIDQDTIIVEPTSGNQGIGLALVGAVKGYRTIIIMPDSVSEERRKLINHYGAELILIHDDNNIGECIDECLQTAMRMAEEDPNVLYRSSSLIRQTRRFIGLIRVRRSWSRWMDRFTVFVRGSVRVVLSQALEKH